MGIFKGPVQSVALALPPDRLLLRFLLF